jgi:hypothetical protein
LPSRAFLQIVCATYLAKNKLSELFQLLASLKDLNTKNTAFQLNILAHQIAVLIKANQFARAEKELNDQKSFALVNSA